MSEPRIDKQRVAASFLGSLSSYDGAATFQNGLGTVLIDALCRFAGRVFPRTLEIGCCTGGLTAKIGESLECDLLYLNDLVDECCERAANRVSGLIQSERLPGDIERIVMPEALDLIVSSATLQWLDDLPAFFVRARESLGVGGILAFSIISAGTMKELSALTGTGLHYHSQQELLAMLADDYFVLDSSVREQVVYFADFREILRHIRQTGVGGLTGKGLSIGALRRFGVEYQSRFGSAAGLPVSYAATTIIAKKR